jgi:hypothetical protein
MVVGGLLVAVFFLCISSCEEWTAPRNKQIIAPKESRFFSEGDVMSIVGTSSTSLAFVLQFALYIFPHDRYSSKRALDPVASGLEMIIQ